MTAGLLNPYRWSCHVTFENRVLWSETWDGLLKVKIRWPGIDMVFG